MIPQMTVVVRICINCTALCDGLNGTPEGAKSGFIVSTPQLRMFCGHHQPPATWMHCKSSPSRPRSALWAGLVEGPPGRSRGRIEWCLPHQPLVEAQAANRTDHWGHTGSRIVRWKVGMGV